MKESHGSREERFAAEAAELGLPDHMGTVLDTVEGAVPPMVYRLLVDAFRERGAQAGSGKETATSGKESPTKGRRPKRPTR